MDKEIIKQAVGEVIDEKLAGFWIEREKHYQHHQFIEEWIQWLGRCKSTTIKAIVNSLVYGAIGLLVLGFVFWGKANLK